MNLAYYYFIVVVLLPRIFLYWNDDPVRLGSVIRALIAEVVLLIPLYSPRTWAVLIPALLVYHTFQYTLQRSGRNLLPKRLLEFFSLVLISSYIFGIFFTHAAFNRLVVDFLRMIIGHSAVIPADVAYSPKKGLFYFLGILLLVNEVNNIVRYILDLMNAGPFVGDKGACITDDRELRRGKIIGVIERIMFFFFVVTNNYASITIVLSIKGFIRFKELDNKDFAEYVLIGTLLSSGLAIVCAALIMQIIKAGGG